MIDDAEEDSTQHATPSELIAKHQSGIINQWLERVLVEIPAARHQSRAEVANHLIELLNNIAGTIKELEHPEPSRVRNMSFISPASKVHGRDRASFENYTVGDVLQEYIILRQVITGFHSEQGPFDPQTADIINQAIESSSLATVNEFIRITEEVQQKLIGSLVHDVRTPLGVANNFVELIMQRGISDEVRMQAKMTISRNLKRAVTMLEELLDFMKMRGGIGLLLHFQELDLSIPLRNVCSEANKIYAAQVIYVPEKKPVVGIFDEALVIRCVENLISNAVKHGDTNFPIHMSLQDHGDHVSIRVHNEGNPIPEEEVDAIFECFAQGNKDVPGPWKSWGLGLTLIRTVTQSHGGDVIIESSAEGGTTFGMTLYKRFRQDGEEEVLRL